MIRDVPPGGGRERGFEIRTLGGIGEVEGEVLKALESEGGSKTRGGRNDGGLRRRREKASKLNEK